MNAPELPAERIAAASLLVDESGAVGVAEYVDFEAERFDFEGLERHVREHVGPSHARLVQAAHAILRPEDRGGPTFAELLEDVDEDHLRILVAAWRMVSQSHTPRLVANEP